MRMNSQSPMSSPDPKRRRLLKLGLGAAALLAVAGGGVALLKPGLLEANTRLAPAARGLMRGVALAVLDGLWPAPGPAREASMEHHLAALDASIAALPAATRAELAQLLSLLCSAPGRLAMTGLKQDWPQASVAEVGAALEGLRHSRLALRQQVYFALRDLNAAVFFTQPEHWALMGYPGPRDI